MGRHADPVALDDWDCMGGDQLRHVVAGNYPASVEDDCRGT